MVKDMLAQANKAPLLETKKRHEVLLSLQVGFGSLAFVGLMAGPTLRIAEKFAGY